MLTRHRHDTDTNLPDLASPERNHYYYGMLMDVYHFERETAYFNQMRRLINRMVLGYGVVFGLDVQPGENKNELYITPGMAIDKLGYEIIVPERVGPIAIPDEVLNEAIREDLDRRYHPKHKPDISGCVQVKLCYKECHVDPAPSLAGDCASPEPCRPSTTREQFTISFGTGCSSRQDHECKVPDLLQNGRLTHNALAYWVTYNHPEDPVDPCIPLANIIVEEDEGHHCDRDNIDITVRPVVYSLDLLYEIILGLTEERSSGKHSK